VGGEGGHRRHHDTRIIVAVALTTHSLHSLFTQSAALVPQKRPRQPLHIRRHGRAKHRRQPVLRNLPLRNALQIPRLLLVRRRLILRLHLSSHRLQNTRNLRLETHIQHPVGLVENDVRALVQHEVRALQNILHPTRRPDNDVHPLPQLVSLLLHIRPANNRKSLQHRLTEQLANLLVNLQRELTSRRHHNRQRPLVTHAVQHTVVQTQHMVHQRDAKTARLSTSRLGNANHIPPLQPDRNRLSLDRTRAVRVV